MRWSLIAATAVVTLTVGCGLDLGSVGERPAGVTTGPGGGAASLRSLIDRLEVADEPRRDGYSRDLFEHWVDISGSGCRARQDVLLDQALDLVQRDSFGPCYIVEGDWYLPFDGQRFAGAPGDIDVDHVVALAEAWDSGADSWSYRLRQQFANDPLHLLVTDRQLNRDKADLDAGDWRPARRDAWCLTATMMVVTKYRYSMTVDPRERDALDEMAETCDGTDQVTVGSYPLPGSAAFDRLVDQITSELTAG